MGTVLRLDVEDLAFGEDAVCRHEGYVLFVPRVLPGEVIEARVTEAGRKYGRAEPLRILEASPARVEPRCRHFGACGGCTWQHLRYDVQARTKGELLRRLLLHRVDAETAAVVEKTRRMAEPWGFREKVQWAVQGRAGAPRMGFYELRSHRLVDVEECPVQPAAAVERARAVKDLLRRRRIPPWDEDRGTGVVRHLVLRSTADGGDVHATVVVGTPRFAGSESLAADLAALRPPLSGAAINLNPERTSRVLGADTQPLTGRRHWTVAVAGTTFRVGPTSFFQTSTAGAEMLVEEVRRCVPADRSLRVLDLYAGVGLFALTVADRVGEVVAVEEHAAAARDGEANAAANGRANVRWIRAPVERAVADRSLGRFPVVIADPPREGLAPGVLKGIVEGCRARTLLLVSCDPTTLARDLALGRSLGGTVERVVPVDMFPHTHHLETVATLRFPVGAATGAAPG